MSKDGGRKLESLRVPTSVKIALLWASVMFLYFYNDYVSMYLPGTIEMMSAGKMGPMGDATDRILVMVSVLMAIPAFMIFLSAALPPTASRWFNIILGLAYTVIEILPLLAGAALFYQIVVGLEVVVTLLIVWYAVRWPVEAR